MNWKVQNDTQRGYNFHYDELSRITAADYQNNDANTDKNYSTTYTYDNMSNIKSLTRYGLSAKPSTFGIIDTLTLNYNGNQLTSIADAVNPGPLYTGAFNFVDSISTKTEYKYDSNGNLTEDLNKKIAKIQYNILNLPSALQFTQGHTTEYLYDAAGVKRRVKQITAVPDMFVSMGTIRPVSNDSIKEITQTDYCGKVIYENGTLSRILVDGGYITMSGTIPTYHYYIQDHLGNNRVVFNQSGTIEQTNHYYPFGMTFGEGTENSDNRYKYNGKELDRMHGLDLYDYGARHYDAAIGRWGVIDPLAEKYYSVSPYAYCANNPIRFVDPD
nr:RHS repeat-associated core domain-containing protein [uncultured Bacteroides sp.]